MTERNQSLSDKLQYLITDEFMKAFGLKLTHWSRPILHKFVKRGTRHFADLCAQMDEDIGTKGFNCAVRNLVPHFINGVYHYGTQNIPVKGPLLITSNHLGGADSLAILTHIQREDVKIVLTGVPFTTALTKTQKHFIPVTPDTDTRSQVIRKVIRHLQNAGAVLIFPTGHVTPDPIFTPDPELVFDNWSESIALILRSVPDTSLLMTIVSGVIAKRFLNSPLCKVRRLKLRQQIMAEFLQITQQMINPTKVIVQPRVTFMNPISGNSLIKSRPNKDVTTRKALHYAILDYAKDGLLQHLTVQEKVRFTSFA